MKVQHDHPRASWRRWWRDLRDTESARDWLGAILILIGVLTLALVMFDDWLTIELLAIPLCLASLVLGPRQLPWVVLLVLLDAAGLELLRGSPTRASFASLAVLVVIGAIILIASLRRSELGVGGRTGETMLVDLRDRILAQGAIPRLPAGWQVEAELKSAGGTPFAGDFVVAGRVSGSTRFDLVLVDVSGKGEQAGTRALLLSGALGGLLAALPPAQFLPAANAFLLRQNWDEGFATAIHLTVDLSTGVYGVRTAGHPPAVVYHSDSQSWTELEGDGPVLGWLPSVGFGARTGVLQPGDAILLYTDGMVETRERDIDAGIALLRKGAGEMLRDEMTSEAVGALVEELGSTEDDRALVAVRRIGLTLQEATGGGI